MILKHSNYIVFRFRIWFSRRDTSGGVDVLLKQLFEAPEIHKNFSRKTFCIFNDFFHILSQFLNYSSSLKLENFPSSFSKVFSNVKKKANFFTTPAQTSTPIVLNRWISHTNPQSIHLDVIEPQKNSIFKPPMWHHAWHY